LHPLEKVNGSKLQEIITIFDNLFEKSERVVLRGGYEEPFYKAPSEDECGEIRFTKDYISSALHEVAHWCVAGTKRRKIDDFDYWYTPDGRNEKQQKVFFQVEVMPQAYELCLSLAAEVNFNISADNLGGINFPIESFKNNVLKKVEELLDNNLRGRHEMLMEALQMKFGEQDLETLNIISLKEKFSECYN
jgi:elongation factor P hydroxylase